MANLNNSARLTHVSPGVYTKETDLTYASKSLGITTLGLVGETVKGPAFQPIEISDWREFVKYFGGTNPTKMSGSQYPKYELPYIAKSYLKQSNQLQVVRTLGLSGANAGDAWVITASDASANHHVVAVIRSRAFYKKTFVPTQKAAMDGSCNTMYEHDKLEYYAKAVKLIQSSDFVLNDECKNPEFETEKIGFEVNPINMGRFTIIVKLQEEYQLSQFDAEGNPIVDWGSDGTYSDETKYKKYSVSLNPSDKNYIYNVIGGSAEDGDAEIYVEELYDTDLKQLIENNKVTKIDSEVVHFFNLKLVPKFEPVEDILTLDESLLSRKMLGKRFLFSKVESINEETKKPLKVRVTANNGSTWDIQDGQEGHIYRVVSDTESNGKKIYFYGEYVQVSGGKEHPEGNTPATTGKFRTEALADVANLKKNHTLYNVSERIVKECVYVEMDDMFYINDTNCVKPVTFDVNNYKEQYRCASTPWILSEIKGSSEDVELKKLFRFHTISDGNSSNSEIKISISNINPTDGTFVVLVRDFNDSDLSPIVLERFKCDLVPGSSNYIALKIGSFDEHYEVKSKYITVEVNEDDTVRNSIPCGFMGYPVRDYGGTSLGSTSKTPLIKPSLKFNTTVDEDIKVSKQYFGVSDLVGIDTDIFTYKGVEAYNNLPNGLTDGFHLDSRIIEGKPNENGYVEVKQQGDALESGVLYKQRVSIDGVSGYEWQTVNKGVTTYMGIEPRIGNEEVMEGTIYEDIKYRKFTVCFYGGFDGWDFNRKVRSNGDEFRYAKYKGTFNYSSGVGANFSVIKNPEDYNFEDGGKYLNSDYYAYLAAIREFANPKAIDINVLATPGIDYVNNKSLVEEVISMVENERADSIYVVTTPDKPMGSNDTPSEMFSPEDAVWNLEDSDINSNYTCSYYPWIKYFDADNNVYLYLPPTKDVVRNFAFTDNTTYPWFAPAGWNRGGVEGVNPKKTLKIDEQDTLYEGRLNYINKFAKEGMKIWGDKNMQVAESQMNRISKRRLLLHIRKLCSIACVGLIFDPNDNTMKKSFESAVTPILNNIMGNRGITDWRLEIDDSVEARERLELPAKIYIKPTPTLEYISIDFVITPQGTNWDDVL